MIVVMGLLEALASAFISTFGITQPTEKTRRQAAWFILGMMMVVILVLLAVGGVLMHVMKA